MTRDYTRLPEPTPIEDTIAEHETHVPADPDEVRSADQHAALRDD